MDYITQALCNSWDYITQLFSNPLSLIFVIILPIICLILAYKSIPQKVLIYTTTDNILIANKEATLKHLSVTYNKKKVTQLTITTITFWNNSFPTINFSDIVDADPLRILIKNGKILSASVLKGYNTSNCVDVELIDKKTALINFDYLDRKEGGIVQVVHTDGEKSISLSNKIKGGKVKFRNIKLFQTIMFFIIFSIYTDLFIYIILISSFSVLLKILASILLFILTIVVVFYSISFGDFIPKNCTRKRMTLIRVIKYILFKK